MGDGVVVMVVIVGCYSMAGSSAMSPICIHLFLGWTTLSQLVPLQETSKL